VETVSCLPPACRLPDGSQGSQGRQAQLIGKWGGQNE